MKKKSFSSKLRLNKKAISHLNTTNVKGGWFTTGCTDGCSPAQTEWNCTGTMCSKDCTNGVSEYPACTREEDGIFGR